MHGSHRIRRGIGKAVRGLLLWLLIALVFWAVTALLPGIDVPSFGAVLVTTALIAILHALLWPLLIRLLLPLTVLTFGLGSLVLNAALVSLSIELVDGSAPAFFRRRPPRVRPLQSASWSSPPALGFDDDARQLRLVRRRARRARMANRTDVPGVIMFEIDGLSEPVLRRALSEGYAPTMARWLEESSHRIVPLGVRPLLADRREPGRPASGQQRRHAGLPLVREGERADDGVQSRQGRRRARAASLGRRRPARRRRREPREHVLRGRAALLGDDERAARPRARQHAGVLRLLRRSLRVHAHGRTLPWDVLLELRAARRQRKRGAEHVERGGLYPLIRASITVVMRDLNVATLLGDIVEGVPVVYSTFVGYDEVAHHSGIEEPDAFAVLRQHDAQLARLERAIEHAPRPYHLVVLSDHGQAQGRPFRQRYGVELEELVRGALTGGEVYAPRAPDEGLSSLGGALTDARDEDGPGGKILARATRDRVVDGDVVLGPNRDAVQDSPVDASAPRRRRPRVRAASG